MPREVPEDSAEVANMLARIRNIQLGERVEYAACVGNQFPNTHIIAAVYQQYLDGRSHQVQRVDGPPGDQTRIISYLAVGAHPPFRQVIQRSERIHKASEAA